jgi:hypothetical protein
VRYRIGDYWSPLKMLEFGEQEVRDHASVKTRFRSRVGITPTTSSVGA